MSAQQLFDYLEGRLTIAERTELERRLASEPALQQDLEAAREVTDGFAALRNVAPPADLLDRTRRQIRAAGAVAVESPETRRAWSFPQWAWPVSATVIVLIGGGLLFIREESGRRNAPLASSAMPSSETAERADADATVTPLAAGAPIAQAPPAASAADLAGLNESLARTAEKNLPAPTLASEKIDIPSPAGELNARAEEVMRIVSAIGGTALKGDAPAGEERVLAYIPQEEIEKFRKAVTRVSDGGIISGGGVTMDKLTAAERDSTRRNLRQLDDRTDKDQKSAKAKPQAASGEKRAEAPGTFAGYALAREESKTATPKLPTAPAALESAPVDARGLAKKAAAPAIPSKARGGLGLASTKQSGAKEEQAEGEAGNASAAAAPKRAAPKSDTVGSLLPDPTAADEKSKTPPLETTPAAITSGAIGGGVRPRQLIEIIIHTAPAAK